MSDNADLRGRRKIGSLRDLPRDLAPPRDLWQAIEAHISAATHAVPAPAQRSGRTGRLRVLAAAAVIVALAVGIWIGRAVLPGAPAAGAGSMAANLAGVEPGSFHAAYVMDSKYVRQRAELVKDLESRLAALPPESRAKVMSSLQTLADSKRDLETELGKDPSNALLQELLVNTYQDEMRVLTAVHEAGSPGEGI
jgi:hypothetical protein